MDKRKGDIELAKIKSAVEAMKPLLKAASEAEHEMKDIDAQNEDDGYRDFDRTVELGYVTEVASALCPAHLSLLFDVACVLEGIEDGDDAGDARVPRS